MCNLKSNKNLKEMLEYKKEISKLNLDRVKFVLFPTSLYLGFFYNVPYLLGSQNISKYGEGSFTGEIKASQLKSLKVSYVIVNHHECLEKKEDVILKIKNAVKENINVVLCFGEKEKNTMEEVINLVRIELYQILSKLTKKELEMIILAYEPYWTIGKGIIPKIEVITKIVSCMKEEINIRYKLNIPIIYGGGINNKNKNQIKKVRNIDGYLLGSYANDPENISKFLKNI